jgi:hypothetical protein
MKKSHGCQTLISGFLLIACLTTSCGKTSSVNYSSGPKKEAKAYAGESKEEETFKNELTRIIGKSGMNICYYLGNASYFLEHLAPLYHVYPAQFCGVPTSRELENKSLLQQAGYSGNFTKFFADHDDLEHYFDNAKNIMVGCSGINVKPEPKGFISLGHGIDADGMYYDDLTYQTGQRPNDDISLVFTKYLESTFPTRDSILDYYGADRSRKTVLFLPTEGILEFIDKRAPQHVRE